MMFKNIPAEPSLQGFDSNNHHRQGIIELWRFLSCVMIMCCHKTHLGVYNHGWYIAWIYVEFFFILTGFFTMKHFSKYPVDTLEDKAKAAINYTYNKFKTFVPYIVITVLISCIINYIYNGFPLGSFLNMILEMLLITRGDSNVGTLWFLSAMFIVFPIFCCMCQIKSKHFFYIISLLYVVLYYEKYDVKSLCFYPEHIYRALAGLLLGVLVYSFVELINQMEWSGLKKIILTILEEGSLLLTVYLTYCNKDYNKFILFCFVLGLTIMLSNQSYTSKIKGSLFDWLGKISLVIYIVHLPIADYLYLHCPSFTLHRKYVLYFGGAFTLAIILYVLVEKAKKFKLYQKRKR